MLLPGWALFFGLVGGAAVPHLRQGWRTTLPPGDRTIAL
jgi:hypothetical protein